MVQILKDGEFYQEVEDDSLLPKAKLRAELLDRDNKEKFEARIEHEKE